MTTFKKIPLTQGQFAIVSPADYDMLSKIKWQAIKKRVDGPYYAKSSKGYMHRMVLDMSGYETFQVDHKNGNCLDNRRDNLRICTNAENARNRHAVNTASGEKGVTWDWRTKSWKAQIMLNYKNIHLGRFVQKEHAAAAYQEAAKRFFGQFASLNKQEY